MYDPHRVFTVEKRLVEKTGTASPARTKIKYKSHCILMDGKIIAEARSERSANDILQTMDMSYPSVTKAIAAWFGTESYQLGEVVSFDSVKGAQQGKFGIFNSVFVSQEIHSQAGDEFHGTVYFHLGSNQYATAKY